MSELLIKQLENAGLQPNEAKVYLALLGLGRGRVTDISKAAHLNRTTGYDILERLCLYGVVDRGIEGKKKIYLSESPFRMQQFLESRKKQAERRLEELKKFLPDLQSLYKTDLKPSIRFAEGIQAMKNMYLHVLDAKGTVYSILNLKNYAEVFDEFGLYQAVERNKRNIAEKVLAVKSDVGLWWYNKKLRKTTEYRWLEGTYKDSMSGEVLIFDDKVISMLSKPTENMVFEIQSQTFADFLKIIFEMAWSKAGKSGDVKK
jgi:sugar-specific transcriptional regulator TrmB